jgi:hypothetical protein
MLFQGPPHKDVCIATSEIYLLLAEPYRTAFNDQQIADHRNVTAVLLWLRRGCRVCLLPAALGLGAI